MDLALEIITEKPQRTEIWNLKNRKCQETFKNITSSTNEFTDCFKNELPLQKQIENWKSTLKKHIGRAFTKVRIRNKPKTQKVPEKIKSIS